MPTVKEIIAIILILIGLFFAAASVFGLFRFKFVLNRMHAAAMCDTLAILFVLIGLILITGISFTSLKLGMIIIFLWFASPVSSHLISNLVCTTTREKVLEECEIIDKDEERDI